MTTINADYDAAYGPDCQLRWQDRADIDFATSYDVERELLAEQFDSVTAMLLEEQLNDDAAVEELIASGFAG